MKDERVSWIRGGRCRFYILFGRGGWGWIEPSVLEEELELRWSLEECSRFSYHFGRLAILAFTNCLLCDSSSDQLSSLER